MLDPRKNYCLYLPPIYYIYCREITPVDSTRVHVHCRCTHTNAILKAQWLKLPAWKVGDRGFGPRSGLQVSKKQNNPSLLPRKDLILWGVSGDQEIACSALDRQGPNFASCVWRALSSYSIHHPKEALLAQFTYIGFIFGQRRRRWPNMKPILDQHHVFADRVHHDTPLISWYLIFSRNFQYHPSIYTPLNTIGRGPGAIVKATGPSVSHWCV